MARSRSKYRRRPSRSNVHTLPTRLTQDYYDPFGEGRHYTKLDLALSRKDQRRNEHFYDSYTYDDWVQGEHDLRVRSKRIAERLNRHFALQKKAMKRINPWKVAAVGAAATQIGSKSICVQRSERKQVMFATNKAGRRGQRSPIWTKLSRVRCK